MNPTTTAGREVVGKGKVLRREAGQAAGVVALILTGLACLLWLPTLGLWRATFPVMVVLGPLHLILYGGWR